MTRTTFFSHVFHDCLHSDLWVTLVVAREHFLESADSLDYFHKGSEEFFFLTLEKYVKSYKV